MRPALRDGFVTGACRRMVARKNEASSLFILMHSLLISITVSVMHKYLKAKAKCVMLRSSRSFTACKQREKRRFLFAGPVSLAPLFLAREQKHWSNGFKQIPGKCEPIRWVVGGFYYKGQKRTSPESSCPRSINTR